jgi:ferredoxin/flavodoxin
MIFYFSGTGNSLFAAKNIAQEQGEKILSIAKELDEKGSILEYELKEGELLGFIFPVYAWAPPRIVLDFIRQMKLSGGNPYIFSLSTCGAEEGQSTSIIQKSLNKKGYTLANAFTLQMPNNYMLGVDVDSKEVQIAKLHAAGQRLQKINEILRERQRNVFQLIPGKGQMLKSVLINPMFNRFGMNSKNFYATEKCTSCGTCERGCPVHTITVKVRPAWKRNCTHCLACINSCPVQAIQYGKGTLGKGRYLHPDLQIP